MVSARGCGVVLAAVALAGCCGAQPRQPLRDVIDVHTHAFNARSLPVEGFLEVNGVPGWLAWLIRRVIQAYMGREEGPVTTIVADPAEPTNAELERLEEELRRQLREAGREMPPAEGAVGTVARSLRWALLMTCEEEVVVKKLTQTYSPVRLSIVSLMDMEHWFPGPGPSKKYEAQVEDTSEHVREADGRLLAFVAFDPEREVRFRNRPEGALAIVKRAIEEQGYVGVKLYPPLGYRPSGNARDYERRGKCRFPTTLAAAARYDEVLEELYTYCENNDVPIAAHCEDPGAQSWEDCGKYADPAGWEDVLVAHPGLRLNLMHFGGDLDLATRGEQSWAWKTAELMGRFPHVYADVGAHDVPVDATLRRDFLANLAQLYADYPAARTRLMFGSDWHMIVRHPDHRSFLDGYVDALARGPGVDVARFTNGAAIEYLGLKAGSRTRERLAAYFGHDRFGWLDALGEDP